MVKATDAAEYEFSLRETRTWDIIEDVRTLRSELGILYRNDFNRNSSNGKPRAQNRPDYGAHHLDCPQPLPAAQAY